MERVMQYATAIRPEWAPPVWLFTAVWYPLYAIIVATFGYMLWKFLKKETSWASFLPFGLNLLFNVSFLPLLYEWNIPMLASVDMVLLLLTTAWLIVVSWKRYRWIAIANIPYLLWVCYITVLHFSVLALNG